MKEEKKMITIEVDKGAPDGDQYVKHGEGHEIANVEPGDVIVQIKQKKHKTFLRRGADLFMEKNISLLDALTGVEFIFPHLDGRPIKIKSNPGEIISPDQMFTVEALGMPFHKKTYEFGNLIIQFKVIFPDHLEADHIDVLKKILPTKITRKSSKAEDESTAVVEETKVSSDQPPEEYLMKKFEEHHRNTHHRGG
jgi:DnaJ family protein A protein 2